MDATTKHKIVGMLDKEASDDVRLLFSYDDDEIGSRMTTNFIMIHNHLTIRQAEVSEIIVEDHKITGVKTYSGAVYHAKAVVLATGTYLKARCIYGDVSNATGPNGLQPANHLTDSLIANGIEMFRFKTGTPARADRRSIDFSKMEEQFGEGFGEQTRGGFRQRNSGSPFAERERRGREGEVRVHKTAGTPEKRVSKDVGDYVDFEEEKEQ